MKTSEALLSLFKVGENVDGRSTMACWWLLISTFALRLQGVKETGLVGGQKLTVA